MKLHDLDKFTVFMLGVVVGAVLANLAFIVMALLGAG